MTESGNPGERGDVGVRVERSPGRCAELECGFVSLRQARM